VDLDPANLTSRMMHAHALAANGRVEDAKGVLFAIAREEPTMAWARMACAMRFALSGEREEMLQSITPDLREAAQSDEIFSWWLADCYALAGERKPALDCVERMIDLGVFNYPFLAQHEPFLRRLHEEPRFIALLERVRKQWDAFEA